MHHNSDVSAHKANLPRMSRESRHVSRATFFRKTTRKNVNQHRAERKLSKVGQVFALHIKNTAQVPANPLARKFQACIRM